MDRAWWAVFYCSSSLRHTQQGHWLIQDWLGLPAALVSPGHRGINDVCSLCCICYMWCGLTWHFCSPFPPPKVESVQQLHLPVWAFCWKSSNVRVQLTGTEWINICNKGLFCTYLLAVWFHSLVIPLIIIEFLSGLHNYNLQELKILFHALKCSLSHSL